MRIHIVIYPPRQYSEIHNLDALIASTGHGRNAVVAHDVPSIEPHRQRITTERLLPFGRGALRMNMQMRFVAVAGVANEPDDGSSLDPFVGPNANGARLEMREQHVHALAVEQH